jgi:FkbM family methyltransferase
MKTGYMLAAMESDWLENEFRKLTMVMTRSDLRANAVCRVLGKYPMEILTRDIGCSTHLALDGFWEMWITRAIAKHVAPGTLCIDVGANVGYFTVVLGAVMGCLVHAFEPQEDLCDLIRRTCKMNGIDRKVIIHNLAAGSEVGEAVLGRDHDTANAQIIRSGNGSGIKTRIPVDRIDNLLCKTPTSFVKIDAEGYEPYVIDGMEQLINDSPGLQICMEWTPSKYDNASHFMDFMRRKFQLCLIGGGGDLTPATDIDIDRLIELGEDDFENVWFRRTP